MELRIFFGLFDKFVKDGPLTPMTPDEIRRVEKELGTNVPVHYAKFLSTFEGLNNSEADISHFLYSSPDHLIEMNQMVGFHLQDKIVKNKLIIGDNGGGDFYLINLIDASDEAVYVFDHEEAENFFDKKKGAFDWGRFEKYDTVESYRVSVLGIFE